MQQDQNGGQNNRYGYNGEPLSRPPSRTANGTVRRSRTDNSIQFPTPPPRPAKSSGGSTVEYPARQRPARPEGQQRPAQARPAVDSRKKARRPQGKNLPRSAQSQPAAQQRYKSQRLRPAQQPVRDPARREGRKKRKVTRATLRRRRIMRRLLAFVTLLCVIGAGVYLTMTMLFRVNSIQVQTADGAQVSEIAGYSAESILQVLDVQLEQNIFSFEPGAKEAVLERQFPLLESIRVLRDYPSTVVVQVTEATPAYTVQSGSSWLIVSDQFKILSTDSTQPAGLCTLYGGTVENATPGEKLQFTDGTAAPIEPDASQVQSGQETDNVYIDVLLTIRNKLDEYGMLGDVTRIEFADKEQIAFLYQDRISVLLGTANDLDYKLDRARYVLTDADGKGCGPTDTGRLDFSHSSAGSTRKIYFAQGEPTLPSGYVVPPKVEETAEPETTEPSAEDAAAAQPEETTALEQLPLTDPARMTATEDENPM